MTRKYFGTDGIRGRVGEMPITPDFCLRLGWAAGRVFAQNADRLDRRPEAPANLLQEVAGGLQPG